ncbi:hypothetical protein PC128_g17385 [Phytophthora cactorum]|nr:hypothetical protein PC128_g17385 [Phytophthora cactorum]
MTTKATYEATSAGMVASDSAASASKAAVVDVTDGDDPWTTTSARSTMDPPPLCTSKCAASRVATGAALVEAREGKKKVTKHAYESIAVRTGRKKPEEGEGGASDVTRWLRQNRRGRRMPQRRRSPRPLCSSLRRPTPRLRRAPVNAVS